MIVGSSYPSTHRSQTVGDIRRDRGGGEGGGAGGEGAGGGGGGGRGGRGEVGEGRENQELSGGESERERGGGGGGGGGRGGAEGRTRKTGAIGGEMTRGERIKATISKPEEMAEVRSEVHSMGVDGGLGGLWGLSPPNFT